MKFEFNKSEIGSQDWRETVNYINHENNNTRTTLKKYNMYEVLSKLLDEMPSTEWLTIQCEIFGESVQRNTYGLSGREIRVFNLITSDKGRWNSCDMKEILLKYCFET